MLSLFSTTYLFIFLNGHVPNLIKYYITANKMGVVLVISKGNSYPLVAGVLI